MELRNSVQEIDPSVNETMVRGDVRWAAFSVPSASFWLEEERILVFQLTKNNIVVP